MVRSEGAADGDRRGGAGERSCGIFVHETVHALGVGHAEYGRERAEAIVDTAIAYRGVGLKVEYESIPYIAGWGETGELDAATACAQHNR